MCRIAVLLSLVTLMGCGDVYAVQIIEPPGCSPLVLGDSMQLMAQMLRTGLFSVATTSAENPSAFRWASANPATLGVSSLGVVAARSLGTGKISVTAGRFRSEVIVVVQPARSTAAVTPSALTLRIGEKVPIRAQAWDTAGTLLDLTRIRGGYFWILPYPRPVEVLHHDSGTTLVGVTRGSVGVNWAAAGRCGIVSATVR